ncbi:hypothetical protein NLX86_04315 [Streptomyces sp. A3M-1-3]|uniref:hypothetical protein n=1 Tax=Streptomyces sp. A3M-1-3 TaxID=2962044 RepID=UPI0020B6FBF1|nr:hypothetical protein [Streptomyces sp. A3M-1-3]MCP3817391.1 hypothetical protein [Streptomyces sp. A3M-1-3]
MSSTARPERRARALLLVAWLETAVTAVAMMCWLLLAVAMYMESYDLDHSAPEQPEGYDQIAVMAFAVLGSLAVSWLLRLRRNSIVRGAANGLILVRIVFVVAMSGVMLADLLNG